MGFFNKLFGRSSSHAKGKGCVANIDFEEQVRQDGVPHAAKRIAELVNERIDSRKLARQLVLEELDAARQGNNDAVNFVKNSGFSPSEYIGAMQQSEWGGDASALEHLQLLLRTFTFKIQNVSLMVQLSTAIIDEIMKRWELGKYATQKQKKDDEYNEIITILEKISKREPVLIADQKLERAAEDHRLMQRLFELTGKTPEELLDNNGQKIQEYLKTFQPHIDADEIDNQDKNDDGVNLNSLTDEEFLEYRESGNLSDSTINATEQEDIEAQYNLGVMHNKNNNYKQAFQLFLEIAQQGHAKAQMDLGIMYAEGAGIQQDYNKALEWFTKAAEQRYASAQANLGLMYFRGEGTKQDYSKATEWFLKAAEQEHAGAQLYLGIIYSNGLRVPKDEVKAAQWMRKSAEQGVADAQFNLGAMYANGQGVDKNEAKAVEWYKKSAEQGNAKAQFNLGIMYMKGQGVPIDEAKAMQWIRKAAEQGLAEAQPIWEAMYANGQRVPDEANVEQQIRKAADRGDARAQFQLAYMYQNGHGMPEDEAKAVEWYKKSAEQGFAEAQSNLGAMYLNGMGVPKDEVKAVEWLRKAAEQEAANAQFMLGMMYGSGQGVLKDESKAKYWLKKAADQGSREAISVYNKICAMR